MSDRIAATPTRLRIALMAALGLLGPISGGRLSAQGVPSHQPSEEDREHARRMEKLQRELQILQAKVAIKQAEIQKAQAEYQLRKLEEADRADEKTSRAEPEPATLNRPLTVEEERAVRNKLLIEDAQRAAIPFPDEVVIEFVPADGQDRPKPGEERARVEGGNAPKTRAILDALDRPLAMPFPDKTPLDQVLKYIKKSTVGDRLPDGIPIFVDRAALGPDQGSVDSPVALRSEGVPLKQSLDALLLQVGMGYIVRDGLLTITSKQKAGQVRKEDPRTAAIFEALDRPISMPFANETPIEDVLKYIRQATISPDLIDGIPMHVDPVGLQEVEKSLLAPVKLNLEGVPLKTSLKLLLHQLGLTYTVRDGLLTITTKAALDREAKEKQ